MKICGINGCKNNYVAKGFCNTHYLRFKRHNDPLYERPNHVSRYYWKGQTCEIDGCIRDAKKKGICPMHYRIKWMESKNAK